MHIKTNESESMFDDLIWLKNPKTL